MTNTVTDVRLVLPVLLPFRFSTGSAAARLCSVCSLFWLPLICASVSRSADVEWNGGNGDLQLADLRHLLDSMASSRTSTDSIMLFESLPDLARQNASLNSVHALLYVFTTSNLRLSTKGQKMTLNNYKFYATPRVSEKKDEAQKLNIWTGILRIRI
ncbi:hypothetical protein B0H10DRAFT_2045894 [Mycena sp. CBHHK59/15]|nr:hypothetical protein B0H10DRAFT_2045894 [Mycena sp. CBHHK59/15]